MAYCVCTQLHSFSFENLSFHSFLCLMCGSLSVHYDAPWKLSKIIQLLINSISKYALLCLTLFKISPSIWETRRPLHNAALNTIFLSLFYKLLLCNNNKKQTCFIDWWRCLLLLTAWCFFLLWFIKHYFLFEKPLQLLPLTFFLMVQLLIIFTGLHLILTLCF